MSKFNVETAFSELSKKVAALTAKISAQSTLIEAQNKKLCEQQGAIENYCTAIFEQKKVIDKLSSKIDLLSASTSSAKSVIEDANRVPAAQCVSETSAGASVSHNAMTARARRATERAKNKGEPTLQNLERGIDTDADARIKKVENECSMENAEFSEWKVVRGRKNKKARQNVILKGGNDQIATFKAIEKKKFLHVWSLLPDTSEETLVQHITNVCGTSDIKVEKLVPKTKREYSSFMVGVPESHFDKINKSEIWPLHTQFNEWVWFRNYHTTRYDSNKEH